MLGFVDDKCLLSTSFSEMQDMLDVAVRVSRTQHSVYSLPKSVLIQTVCRFPQLERRQRIALTLKGMHGEPVTMGEQVVMPQAGVDVRGKAVNPRESVREVHWWKYVGVALQADMKHDKMVDQMVGAGKAKAVAMGNYIFRSLGGSRLWYSLPWLLPHHAGRHDLCRSGLGRGLCGNGCNGAGYGSAVQCVGWCASISLWVCEVRHEGAVSIGSWVAIFSVGGGEERFTQYYTREWCS
jgi:hypothetical protein